GFVGTDTVAVVSGSPTFSGTGPSSTATTTVGNYVITPALGTLSAANYDFTTFNNGTLAINPVTATVKADNKSKPYGDLNPALTATVTGTVNGDVLNYTLSTTALQFSNVGNYPITVTLGSNPNYNVTKANGTLHVSPKDASVTADNKSK